MAVEGVAGVAAGSVALMGFGLDSAIEGAARGIVIWRFHRQPDARGDLRSPEEHAVSTPGGVGGPQERFNPMAF